MYVFSLLVIHAEYENHITVLRIYIYNKTNKETLKIKVKQNIKFSGNFWLKNASK